MQKFTHQIEKDLEYLNESSKQQDTNLQSILDEVNFFSQRILILETQEYKPQQIIQLGRNLYTIFSFLKNNEQLKLRFVNSYFCKQITIYHTRFLNEKFLNMIIQNNQKIEDIDQNVRLNPETALKFPNEYNQFTEAKLSIEQSLPEISSYKLQQFEQGAALTAQEKALLKILLVAHFEPEENTAYLQRNSKGFRKYLKNYPYAQNVLKNFNLIKHPKLKEIKKLIQEFKDQYPEMESMFVTSLLNIFEQQTIIAGLSLAQQLDWNEKYIEQNKKLNEKIDKIYKAYKLENEQIQNEQPK